MMQGFKLILANPLISHYTGIYAKSKVSHFYDFFFNKKINVVAFYSIKKNSDRINFCFTKKNVTDYVHKTFHYFIYDGIEMLSYEGCQIIYAF